MLKSEVIEYNFMGGEIQDEIDNDILKGMLSYCDLTVKEVDDHLEFNSVPSNSNEGRIRNIAHRFKCKIISITFMNIENLIGDSQNDFNFLDKYGIIYDDDVEVEYEENYEIVTNEFIINNL